MPDISNLISRMCLLEPNKNSSDSMSWHAHREAENLSDPAVIDELLTYLSEKHSKDQRKAVYFILGKIGKNIGSTKASHALIQCLISEKDKYVLSTALDMIADLPLAAEQDISTITALLLDSRWLVRHAAIRALQSSPSSELCLIDLLENTNDNFDKIYCHSTLSIIGTERSLPLLQASLTSRKRDVKDSATNAIENIQRRMNN